jgi:hypothetical protein
MVFTRLLRKLRGTGAAAELEPVSESELTRALLSVTRKPKGHDSEELLGAPLAEELTRLIVILKEEFAGRLDNPMRAFACFQGQFQADSNFKSPKISYVFLRVPGRPGFLIEQVGTDSLDLFRATEALPMLWSESEAHVVRDPVFTRRPARVASLVKLELDLWQWTFLEEPPQLWSTSQVAEHLLARSVQELSSV